MIQMIRLEVTRFSPFSGEKNVMHVNVTPEGLAAYKAGALIQDAFPNLSADEREFIMTGIPAAEFPS